MGYYATSTTLQVPAAAGAKNSTSVSDPSESKSIGQNHMKSLSGLVIIRWYGHEIRIRTLGKHVQLFRQL